MRGHPERGTSDDVGVSGRAGERLDGDLVRPRFLAEGGGFSFAAG